MLKMRVVNRSKERGMTLLEIVITMSVLGILAALGMPNLFGMLDKNNLDQSLDKLVGAIQNAQRQAIRNDQSCGIYIGQQSGTYKLAGLNGNEFNAARNGNRTDWKKSQGCVIQAEGVTVTVGTSTANVIGFNLPSGVEVKTNHTRGFIEFTSKGFPNFTPVTGVTNGAVIVLKAKEVKEQRCVFVSPTTGIIRTGKYLGSFNGTLDVTQCEIKSLY